METMQICPICGATNLTTNTRCVRCARFLFPSVPSGGQPEPIPQTFLDVYDLLWFDEVVLSAQDYTTFTQLFAALIVTKAGCPLLDFRLPLRKRKKSSDSPGVSPSSAWKEYV